MYEAKLRNLLLLGALTLLSGCLAINATLGVLGAIGPPAASLAGAAYTVAEYSYEYGAHQRTPDEVFLAKFDWLLDDGDEPDPAAFAGALSAAMTGPRVTDLPRPNVMIADASSKTVREIDRPAVPKTVAPTATATAAPKARIAPAPRVAMVSKGAARPPARTSAPRAETPVPAPSPAVPVHTYVEHTPDPLLARLDRLENGLAQAEALYLSESERGVRLSVPPTDGDPCAQGVNGGSSLRLPLMKTVPGVQAGHGQPAPQSIRSLNT